MNSLNIVWSSDKVWVSDIFDYTFIYHQRKTVVGLCLILDIPYNKILGVQVFLKKSNKGSVKSSRVCNLFKRVLDKTRLDDRGLIIHCDRGSEYASKQFSALLQKYPNVIGSMSEMGRPKQNSVAERMVRTLKNQLKGITEKYSHIQSIKQAQAMFEEKMKFYNERKIGKALGLTPLQGREADKMNQSNERTFALPFNHPEDKHNIEIVALKHRSAMSQKQKILDYRLRNPLDLLQNTEHNVIQIRKEIHEQGQKRDEQHQAILDYVSKIDDKVSLKEKVFRKHLPLRDPATKTIFEYLMNQPKSKKQKTDAFYAFRIAITIHRHTGLRVNEIKEFTEKQIQQFIEEKRLQVYQSKQNRYRDILMTEEATKDFMALKNEIRYLFNKRQTLSNCILCKNWITFINKKLLGAANHYKLNIKSHSFGVNRITSLLRLALVQKVGFIMGHIDIRSTMAYNRYDLKPEETLHLLEMASKDGF